MFVPSWNALQPVCSYPCAIEWLKQTDGQEAQRKARKAIHRVDKERIKTKGELIKEVQVEFNKWIRLRDANLPCICCGKADPTKKYNACHFRSVGAYPELRFEPDNVHRGCETCNSYLSGNLVNYRIGLIDKVGIERVEWLEGPHPPTKWTKDELREMKRHYRKLNRNSGQ